MKTTITLLLMLTAIAVIFSCKKLAPVPIINNQGQVSLEGNWSLVNDSTTTDFWGLWNGLPSTGKNYAGKPADHYNFSSNGILYIKDGGITDTAAYTLIKNNSIKVNFTYLNSKTTSQQIGYYAIASLTGHTMTLMGDTAVSPETVYSHIINLKK